MTVDGEALGIENPNLNRKTEKIQPPANIYLSMIPSQRILG